MAIKHHITRLAEKLTGRKCGRCKHNCGGRCCHPNGNMFLRCWNSITRPGFEYSASVEYAKAGEMAAQGLQDGLAAAQLRPMTAEEEYQLQKIREVLQEAEDEARESGLLSED